MTLMVLLYLWYFKKVDMDDVEYTYQLEQFVQMANSKETTPEEDSETKVQQSIF